MKRAEYTSVLARLDELCARGVELRLLHAELPSRPFREELAQHPALVAGGLALRRCPRVHMKAVIVDGELLYLGSANWTGAGLGAKGSGRRNFEVGIVTDDAQLLDQIQAFYERIWSGGECAACRLHEECPGPLADIAARATAPDIARASAPDIAGATSDIARASAPEIARASDIVPARSLAKKRRKSRRKTRR